MQQGFYEGPVAFEELFGVSDGAVAPAFGAALFAGEGDAAELGYEDGFAPVSVSWDVDGPVRGLCGDGRLGCLVALCEGFGVAIVVDRAQVRDGVFPTVVGDDGPGRVEGARQVVEGEEVLGLRPVRCEVRDTPALVHRDPGDDAGVVVVAHEGFLPLGGHAS